MLVILNRNGDLVTDKGRAVVHADPIGANFPWRVEEDPVKIQTLVRGQRIQSRRGGEVSFAQKCNSTRGNMEGMYLKPASANQPGILVPLRSVMYSGSQVAEAKPADVSLPEPAKVASTMVKVAGTLTIDVTMAESVCLCTVGVGLVRCTGLAPTNVNGFSDPYIVRFLCPADTAPDAEGATPAAAAVPTPTVIERIRQETECMRNTLDPVFEHVFEFDFAKIAVPRTRSICQLEVWDQDWFRKDAFLGAVNVPLPSVVDTGPVELKLGSRAACEVHSPAEGHCHRATPLQLWERLSALPTPRVG